MTSERPRKTEQQPKGELKGNLGIKEAQLEKEKGFYSLSHGEKTIATDKRST
jgi:hypothetical protein